MFIFFSELWQHVFSDVKEKENEALIAATLFQVYMKVETQRGNTNFLLKQR